MGSNKHFYYTHKFYSSIDQDTLQGYKRMLSSDNPFFNKKDYFEDLPSQYRQILKNDPSVVSFFTEKTFHGYSSNLSGIPLEMLDNKRYRTEVAEKFLVKGPFDSLPSFQGTNDEFIKRLVSYKDIQDLFQGITIFVGLNPIILRSLSKDPKKKREILKNIENKIGRMPYHEIKDIPEILITPKVKKFVVDKMVSTTDPLEFIHFPDVMLESLFNSKVIQEKLNELQQEKLVFGAFPFWLQNRLLDIPRIASIIRKSLIEKDNLTSYSNPIKLKLLEDKKTRDIVVRDIKDRNHYLQLPDELKSLIVEEGHFSEPQHDIHKTPDIQYPQNLSHSITTLLRYMDQQDLREISIEILKEQGFFNNEEIKTLFKSKNQKNKLFYRDIYEYESPKPRENEDVGMDILDFRKAINNKGIIKHQIWTGAQKVFPATNHVFILALPEEYIPDSIHDITMEDGLSQDEIDMVIEEEDSFWDEVKHDSLVEKYITNTDHPGISNHLTLGWVRYTLGKDVTKDKDEDSVWIDEIQTDLHTLIGRGNFKKIMSTDRILYLVMKKFIHFIRSKGFESLYLPDYNMANTLYHRGNSPKAVYTTLPKKMRFKKKEIENFHQRVNGEEVWVLAKKKLETGYTFDLKDK